ncbi:hypothetical protein GCM10010361_17050 [Streptomyces olivaceiscleroticus]|uniref:Uncharacterized protein n=1 Tax=Streptomyces olivaceiscleroticus TaxID=68245 RepID=A0ABN0ZN81_9ACTN
MTDPPEDSTAVVSWLTAVPLAGTSSRTVIEYETLGAVAMADFLCFRLFPYALPQELGCPAHRPIVPPTSQYTVTSHKFRKDSSTIRELVSSAEPPTPSREKRP